MVSFLRFPSDEDDSRYNRIIEADAGGKEAVIFYADEQLYDIAVVKTEYDEDRNAFYELETVWSADTLEKGDGVKIFLDFDGEIPTVMVRYARKNGQIREQYVYKNPKTGKLWLLEQEK